MNAAGEAERDRRSARANRLEAFAVFGGLEFAIWGCVGFGGGSLGWTAAVWLGNAAVAACVIFMVGVAPRLHGDTAAAWGLPGFASPNRPWRAVRQHRREALAIAAAVALALVQGWPNLLARLGLRRHFQSGFEWLTDTPVGLAVGMGATFACVVPAILRVVRWDNFRASVRVWGALALVFALAVAGLAALYRESSLAADVASPLAWLRPHPDRTSVIFYLLWGFVQQALFIGYFNTRLRRGIPAEGWLGIRGRFWVAGLSGLFFGLLHLPTPELVAATGVAGATFGWFFQVDRTRNLFLAAVVHAVVGTLFAGAVPLSPRVGPWG